MRQRQQNKKSSERDQFTVVLESIQSDFRAFGEKLDFIDERLGGKIDRLAADVEFIKTEIIAIKLGLKELRNLLSQKADLKRLEALERRVKRLEILLAKR